MNGFELTIHARDGRARRATLATPHGDVALPAFMPVGTLGAVKSLSPDELAALDYRLVLANTYHLMLRPGHETIRRLGCLHRFMGWDGAILTDSGGFQVFSLAALRSVDDDGVTFRSHLDGSAWRLTPEKAVAIQEDLGADIAMCLDECPPGQADHARAKAAVERTTAWAARCRGSRRRDDQAIFGIVQGGVFEDLRARSLEDIVGLDFPGYAVGGLSVGEQKADTRRVADFCLSRLPEDRPRYLMGIGAPEDLVEGVVMGADMFDCVLPTRNARNGQALTRRGALNVRNAAYAEDPRPIEEGCACPACRRFSRAYVRHLFLAKEILAHRLLTLHNLAYVQGLMAGLRQAVATGGLAAFREDFYANRGEQTPAPGSPDGAANLGASEAA